MSESRDFPSEKAGREEEGAASTGRTLPERITLTVSVLLLLTLVLLVTYLNYSGGQAPASIVVEPRWAEVREEDEQFYLPVEVSNSGDQTAIDLWVRLTLHGSAPEPQQAEIRAATLAGSATLRAVLRFDDDPREGDLREMVSFVEP